MSSKALALFLSLAAALPTSDNVHVARGAPPPLTVGMQWDYPLGYNMTAAKAKPNIPFYSIDLFETAASDISSMKASGHYVACYFSAGTWENWRPDANQYPTSTKGNNLDDWPGERYVDYRNSQVRTIIANRIALAQQKGCLAIDPDNTDSYQNNPGFPLTKSDAVSFIQYMCNQAASKGMKCGLKNTPEVVPNVLSNTAFAIVEECVGGDCIYYKPYIDAGKPVFHVEYDDADDDFDQTEACASDGVHGFSSIIKHRSLDEYRYECPAQ